MGVVYAAYDPELDRKVALKLLRPDRTGAAAEEHRLRLQREAQAIARLSHPNVVAVFDAGMLGDQVFVAMEFVEGKTLREWLKAEPRSWREIVEVFLPAGRGLAAAHDAGLVHRDFKPDNVLLGGDGRVKVADFGLARPVGEVDPGGGEAALAESPGSRGLLATPLTEWGVAMGTPAYMAPEQLRGQRADARSDQFSFCVALWEALYGQKPFAGESFREMLDAERRGEIVDPPAGTKVPARILPVLRRGLAASPEARYPGMAELLQELGRDRSAVRRRWFAAAAVVLVTGALFAGLGYFQARREKLCGGSEERLAGVWDAPRKAAIRTAFVATGAPFAADVWKTVERSLDRYTRDWIGMRHQACEATQVRGEQSEDLLDRRMLCLDQRLEEAAAVSDLFARADRQVLEKALTSASGLTPVSSCADVEALKAKVPPPHDLRLRQRVADVRMKLAQVRALIEAGKAAEALPKAEAAEQEARQLGYGPLEAEALFQKGHVQDLTGDLDKAEETLFAALVASQSAGHQEVAARAAAQLASVTGYEKANAQEGHRWMRLAQGMAEGAKGGVTLRTELLQQLGAILANERRFPEAVEVSRRALQRAEQGLGPDHPRVASLLANLGQYNSQMGKEEEALRYTLRALQIQGKALGPDHPDFAKSYNTLGNIYSNLHRNEEAVTAFGRAVDIVRRQYGPRHWLVAGFMTGLATAHQSLGHLDVALRYDREALAIFEACYGPDHFYDAMVLNNMGEVLRLQEHHDEAFAAYRRALAIQEKNLGPDHPDLGHSLLGIAEALLDLGRAREAIAPADRALALREGKPIHPVMIAQSRFYLARALWDGGGDRGRAIRLARQAREALAAADYTDDQHEVEAWLKERGLSG
jgi:tetratricopeptide (TPR) repeat protein